MFTGLVEATGEVVERKPTGGGLRLRIASPLAAELAPGESLAVNGVCLTVILAKGAEIHADVGPETIRVTTLGSLPQGAVVNLERPLRADGRLGGHFVQGHVDGIGYIEDMRADADFHWLTVGYARELAAYVIHKGSIAVDGIKADVLLPAGFRASKVLALSPEQGEIVEIPAESKDGRVRFSMPKFLVYGVAWIKLEAGAIGK